MTDTHEETGKLLVEHYHKMVDVTSEHFQRRNRSSIWLTLAVGIASLLTWKPQETTPLFVKILSKDTNISNPNDLPLELLQSIFLALIFYLTVNLFHHEGSLWRHYKYLELLEEEIKAQLKIDEKSFVFGLQSSLYPKTSVWVQPTIRWAYSLIFGLLLIWFLIGQLIGDFRDGDIVPIIVDTVISLPTVFYFIAYLLAPRWLNRAWQSANVKSPNREGRNRT